jgi:hypothetical protein
VDRDLSDALAFAEDSEDSQDAFAAGAGDVVDVEGDDLADPRAGVERDQRERLVVWRRAGLDCSEVAELSAFVERARRRDGGVGSRGGRGSGLPVVMEQERTLSRLADLSAVPVTNWHGLPSGSAALLVARSRSATQRGPETCVCANAVLIADIVEPNADVCASRSRAPRTRHAGRWRSDRVGGVLE